VNKLEAQLLLLDAYIGLEQWQKAKGLLHNIWQDKVITKCKSELAELSRLVLAR